MYYIDGSTDTKHVKFLGGMLNTKVKLQGAKKKNVSFISGINISDLWKWV